MSELAVYQEEQRLQVVVDDANLYVEVNRVSLNVLSSTTVELAADDTIPSEYNIVYLSGDGGHVTLTSTPTIAAGTAGQPLTLVGMSESATVTIQDNANAAGTTLHLNHRQDVTLGLYDTLDLICVGGTAWAQKGFSDNA